MKVFDKVGCSLIGWDKDLLSHCGEASFRTLRKYTSAIIIIMLIWWTIGFTFSGRYLRLESIVGRLLVAFAFAMVILLIERVIILNMGGKAIYVFRFVLAGAMALLGSFIFDQLIFQNDLEEAVKKNAKREWLAEQKNTIDDLTLEMEKLRSKTDSLNAEVSKNPFIEIVSVENKKIVIGVDSLGHAKYGDEKSVTKSQLPNPLSKQVEANNLQIGNYQNQINGIYDLQAKADSIVNENFKMHKIGFLEELKASLHVITESWISIVFYVVLFVVMICIELFVVMMKTGEKKCEYDLIIEHQLNLQDLKLKRATDEITGKYLTKTLDKE